MRGYEPKRSPLRFALEAAVLKEHVDGCNSNACDIVAAYNHGYTLWAAHLLIGATECPKTEKAFTRIGPSDAVLELECSRFVKNVQHVKCSKCEATCWDATWGDCCGECGKELTMWAKDWHTIAGNRHPDDTSLDGGPTLRRCAELAEHALALFASETGLNLAADRDAAIMDLLTDIRHYCDKEGLSYDKLNETAQEHYAEEVDG